MLFVYLVYCIVYFHFYACHTEPGYPEKVTMRSTSGKNLSKEEIEFFSPTLKNLLSYRNKGFISLMHGDSGYKITCQKCPNNPIKPLRTHHCRNCRRDIIMMDHHCRKTFSYINMSLAWINNCVGLMN